ncbi:MAG: hypothetical protein ACI9WU_002259 [Myxococcota bacterium]|jgi:hypothetical protein
MSALILLVAAVAWVLAARKTDDAPSVRIAVALQAAGTVLMLFVRGDLPPAGWASAATCAALLPALAIAFRPTHAAAVALRMPMAVLTAMAAVWAATAPGPGVVGWTNWSIPHIVLSILAFGAAATAMLLGAHGLRGRAIGLTLAALVLTAAPLVGERAAAVHGYVDGAPATLKVELQDPAGGTGVIRHLPARVSLPLEQPLRALATLAILAILGSYIVRWTAGLTVHHPTLARIALGAAALHAALLLSAAVPRDLGVAEADIRAPAEATVTREAPYGQIGHAISVPPALSGGPAAPALPLTLALASVGLLLLAAATPGERTRELDVLEGRAVILSTLLLAGAALTGMLWSNYVWGGPALPDPRIYATIVVLGLQALYFVVQSALPDSPRAPSWIAVLAFAVMVLTMLGPDLGWLAPTLHAFGA